MTSKTLMSSTFHPCIWSNLGLVSFDHWSWIQAILVSMSSCWYIHDLAYPNNQKPIVSQSNWKLCLMIHVQVLVLFHQVISMSLSHGMCLFHLQVKVIFILVQSQAYMYKEKNIFKPFSIHFKPFSNQFWPIPIHFNHYKPLLH